MPGTTRSSKTSRCRPTDSSGIGQLGAAARRHRAAKRWNCWRVPTRVYPTGPYFADAELRWGNGKVALRGKLKAPSPKGGGVISSKHARSASRSKPRPTRTVGIYKAAAASARRSSGMPTTSTTTNPTAPAARNRAASPTRPCRCRSRAAFPRRLPQQQKGLSAGPARSRRLGGFSVVSAANFRPRPLESWRNPFSKWTARTIRNSRY